MRGVCQRWQRSSNLEDSTDVRRAALSPSLPQSTPPCLHRDAGHSAPEVAHLLCYWHLSIPASILHLSVTFLLSAALRGQNIHLGSEHSRQNLSSPKTMVGFTPQPASTFLSCLLLKPLLSPPLPSSLLAPFKRNTFLLEEMKIKIQPVRVVPFASSPKKVCQSPHPTWEATTFSETHWGDEEGY